VAGLVRVLGVQWWAGVNKPVATRSQASPCNVPPVGTQ
jgi:hypothetical protein